MSLVERVWESALASSVFPTPAEPSNRRGRSNDKQAELPQPILRRNITA